MARGRPRGPRTARFDGQLPIELIEQIEAWRLAQPVPPARIKAVEYLLTRGLASLRQPDIVSPDEPA